MCNHMKIGTNIWKISYFSVQYTKTAIIFPVVVAAEYSLVPFSSTISKNIPGKLQGIKIASLESISQKRDSIFLKLVWIEKWYTHNDKTA